MAANPQVDASGRPVPFVGEMQVLVRDGVEFQVDNLANVPSGRWSARGTIYLSNIRMVFVASHPRVPVVAFDIPLLFLFDEKFNQPVFACNNLSGRVNPVVPSGGDMSAMGVHSFRLLFKEGGIGTFIPVFFNLLHALRALVPTHSPAPSNSAEAQSQLRADPLPSQQVPVEDMIRHAYVDPNDPSQLYLQQPHEPDDSTRRRTYNSVAVSEESYSK